MGQPQPLFNFYSFQKLSNYRYREKEDSILACTEAVISATTT